MTKQIRRLLLAVLIHALALVWVLWILAPFAWLLISSISPQVELLSRPPHWWPQHPTIGNFVAIFGRFTTGGWTGSQPELVWLGLRNSLYLALGVTLVNLVLGTLAGYAIARLQFRGRQFVLPFFIFSRMVPPLALLIPLFILFRHLNLLDTRLGLTVADLAVTLPFTVWVMKSYFDQFPADLEWAAQVDGCSRMEALVRIVLPLSVPGLIAAGTFAFMTAWNEFVFAVTLARTPGIMPVQPTIAAFYTDTRVEYGVMMAAALLTALPPTFLALLFQRYLVTGLLGGATKG